MKSKLSKVQPTSNSLREEKLKKLKLKKKEYDKNRYLKSKLLNSGVQQNVSNVPQSNEPSIRKESCIENDSPTNFETKIDNNYTIDLYENSINSNKEIGKNQNKRKLYSSNNTLDLEPSYFQCQGSGEKNCRKRLKVKI